MRVSDERYSRDLRRLDLAVRMTRHLARTSQIAKWTGLSARRVRLMQADAMGIQLTDETLRPRGSSPSTLTPLFRSAPRRSEATALALLCGIFEVLPSERGDKAVRNLPTVARGERLCAAFEAYRALVPKPSLGMEDAVLLVSAIVQGGQVETDQCAQCEAVILTHRMRRDRPLCGACAESLQGALRPSADDVTADLFEAEKSWEPVQLQRSLF
jgi:hypothetical protein